MTEDETGRKPEEPSSGPPDRRDGIRRFGDKPPDYGDKQSKPPEGEPVRKHTQFPSLEFVVVIAVILFVLWWIGRPEVFLVREKAKEAETKQNLHEIQLAVERYATDSEQGIYPSFLFGGDFSDSFAVDEKYVSEKGLKPTDWPGNKPMALGDSTCHDVLITEGYLTEYPKNPFIARGSVADAKAVWSRKLTHFCSTSTVNPVVRYVGGKKGDLMVDTAGRRPRARSLKCSTATSSSSPRIRHHLAHTGMTQLTTKDG